MTEWRPRTPLDETSQRFLTALYEGDEEVEHLAQLLNVVSELERQRIDSPLELAAIGYADRGMPVFPCEPRGKRPLTTHGFHDSTTDIATVWSWWSRWPDANIGMPTGHRFDVFDIDGPNGVNMMWGYYPVHGCRANLLDVLAHVSTPSDGGHHLYVPAVAGKKNGIKFWDGLDYRGLGGYVIVPPSIGANGRRYVWLRELN